MAALAQNGDGLRADQAGAAVDDWRYLDNWGSLNGFEKWESRIGFISFNSPGGFEARMTGVAPALATADLRM
jgi:hypothetical protein